MAGPGLSLITATAGTSGTFDRCSASISMPTCVPGSSSVGVSKASVTSTVLRPFSGRRGRVRVTSQADPASTGLRRSPGRSRRSTNRARVGDRHRRHHLHLPGIDEPKDRIALVGAHVIARIVQPLGDRPVERRADRRVPALRLDDAERRFRGGQFSFGAGELAIGVIQLAARCGALRRRACRMRLCASWACFTRSSAAFTAASLTAACARSDGNSNRTSISPLFTASPTFFVISAMRAGWVATTANCAPGNVATTPVALIVPRMFPSRTGSTMTGTGGSASVSRSPLRRHAEGGRRTRTGKERHGRRRVVDCQIKGIAQSATASDFTGLARESSGRSRLLVPAIGAMISARRLKTRS